MHIAITSASTHALTHAQPQPCKARAQAAAAGEHARHARAQSKHGKTVRVCAPPLSSLNWPRWSGAKQGKVHEHGWGWFSSSALRAAEALDTPRTQAAQGWMGLAARCSTRSDSKEGVCPTEPRRGGGAASLLHMACTCGSYIY